MQAASAGRMKSLAMALLLAVAGLTAFPPAFAESSAASRELSAGNTHFRLGRFEAAVAAWTRALQRAGGSADHRIAALARRGEAYQALGRHGLAAADLRAAIAEARKSGNAAVMATLRGSLGGIYLMSGRLVEAESALTASLRSANAGNDPGLAARNLNNIGNLRLAQGKYFEAVRAFEASVEKAGTVKDDRLRATALLNLARASIGINQPRDAAARLGEAVGILRTLGDSHLKTVGLIGAVRIGRGLAKDDPSAFSDALAYDALREAARVATGNEDHRSLSHALGELARMYEESRRYAEALTLTRQALFYAQRLNAPEVLYLWEWQMGRLHRASGDTASALPAYRRAVKSLRDIRAELLVTADAEGRSFRETVAPVLIELVDLLLKESDALREPELIQARLKEARSTVELFKTVELENYFRDDCVSALQAKVKQIDELDAGTAAIYPIFLPDRIEILLSLPGGLSRTTVPVSIETVNEEIVRFARLLQEYWSPNYLGPARRLYEWIVAPIEPKLRRAGVSTLVLIPDGALRSVPISALYDGRRHLVEKYALGVAPGLTLLDPRPLARRKLNPLLSGLTKPVRGFTALPKVDEELGNIRKLHGGIVLKDQTFITRNLRNELDTKPFSVIHIASHAQFDKDPRKSFILTYDGQLDMDGLEKFVKLSRFREEPVELLTLSACTTAEGDNRSALGLSGLAIKAGARSALGSLWSIEDNSTSLLMANFYAQLSRPELSKAEALRRAQIALLRHERYRHPFFWSAFILVGNWL